MQVTKTMLPNKKDIAKHWQHVLHVRKQANISGQRVNQRTPNRYKKPKRYSKKKKISVRLPSGHRKKAPRIRSICQGNVLKIIKHQDMYKVLFFPPFEKKPKISWFSIEGIGGFHSGGKRKCNEFDSEEKELKRKKNGLYEVAIFTHEMVDRMHLITEQDYNMTFNPSKYGNCHFSALAHALNEYGIFCSPTTLRYEVEYLRNNPHNVEGFPLDVF